MTRTDTSPVSKVQTIRVNVDTHEHLMTMVSELVLTRNQLLEIARRHEVLTRLLAGFGIDSDTVHHDVEGMEHHISRQTLEVLTLPTLIRYFALLPVFAQAAG